MRAGSRRIANPRQAVSVPTISSQAAEKMIGCSTAKLMLIALFVAARIVANPISNALQKQLAQRPANPIFIIAVTHALPRVAEMDPGSGLAVESLMASIAEAGGEAKERLKAFLEKRGPKVTRT